MFDGIIALASYGSFGGGQIGDMLNSFSQAGFFSYVLPFLLLFSIIFGLLTQTKIFKDAKGINAVIALAVALMALQFDIVSQFFSEVFPRVGVGLSIILILLIFVGMFFDAKSKTLMWIILGIAAVIFVVILVQTSGSLGWASTAWLSENWKFIAGVVGFFILIAVIVGASTPSDDKFETPLSRALLGK